MAKPSLTPMGDVIEEGIAKMTADITASFADKRVNHVAARLSLAIMPPFLRAMAKELDSGTDGRDVMNAITMTLANMIATSVGSIFSDSDPHEVGAVLMKNLIRATGQRLAVGDLPENVRFSKEVDSTPTGRG